MNVTCSSPVCPVILNSTCVFYEGESLIYTGINTNDSLQVALQKIDAALGVTTVVNIYNSNGTLTGNRTISSGGFTLTIGPVTTFTAAPAISTITQGSVFFAGSGGTISQNNSQFFWDNSTNRLGLGTITPLYKLDISGTARVSSTLEVNSLNGVGSRMVVANASGVLSTQSIPVSGVTSINTTAPITGGPITTTGTIGITQATISTNGYLSSTDWSIFNNKQNALSLTTTGTGGASTLIGSVLNIPQYQSALTNPITGIGAAGQVAYWTGVSSQSGSNNFQWDNTNQRLSITGQNVTNTTTISATCAASTFSLNNVSNHYANFTLSTTSASGSISNILSNNSSLTGSFVLFSSAEGNNLFGTSRNSALALVNNSGTKFYIGTINATDLIFGTTNIERFRLFAGGNLGIGTGATDTTERLQVSGTSVIKDIVTSSVTSALLQLSSTTKGFLPPRMTLVQKNAIATPVEGLIVYQTDGTKGLYLYDGASWRAITII